jgi:hypothetical protein
MVLLALRGQPHGRTIVSKQRRKRQSLLNSHRQSRWITIDLAMGYTRIVVVATDREAFGKVERALLRAV